MAAYTETKTYHTKAHMGMIDVTEDFRHAVEEAAQQKNIRNGTITGFTTGGVAALTTLEFEPGLVGHDLKAALDVFSPYRDEKGRTPGMMTTVPPTSRRCCCPPSSRCPLWRDE